MRRTGARDKKRKDNDDNTIIKKKTRLGDKDVGQGHGLYNIVDVQVLKKIKY